MKKTELVSRIESLIAMSAKDAFAQLPALLADVQASTSENNAGKLVHYVHVMPANQIANCKYPLQMLQCHAAIWDASAQGTQALTRAQAIEACANAGTIVTRQSIERIFAFYQGRMEQEGWIKRETVRE